MEIDSWQDLVGKKIALLGSALENTSLLPHLLPIAKSVTVCEWNKERAEALRTIFPKVQLATGDDYLNNLSQYDVLFRSPGFPVATVEKALRDETKKPLVSSAVDLFLRLTKSPVVGVTGTKGKGTTSTMIGQILEAAGKKVVVAGNIGRPIFDIFNDLTSETVVVLELSSFQLEDLSRPPQLAVILPVTEDHLQPLSADSPNFHPSINDYVAAKARITIGQSARNELVFAADNDFSTSIAAISKAKKIAVSQLSELADWFVDTAGQVYHRQQRLLDLKAIGLRGQHVFLDATIAAAVADLLGCRISDVENGLRAFRPLPHRLETFSEQNRVTFVDDSYATAPDAAIAAIESFDSSVIWLGGGSSKGASFEELARRIARSKVKQALLLGQEAPKIAAALTELAPATPAKIVKSLKEAVTIALRLARPGDTVLLSPGCASKDMFINAADRGDQFQQLVKANFESR